MIEFKEKSSLQTSLRALQKARRSNPDLNFKAFSKDSPFALGCFVGPTVLLAMTATV